MASRPETPAGPRSRSTAPRIGRAATLAVLIFVLLSGSGNACHSTRNSIQPPPSPGEEAFVLYLVADDASASLSLDPNTTAAPEFVLEADATRGLKATPDGVQGKDAPTYELALDKPLARPAWLNLTKYVVGRLWVAGYASQAAPRDATHLRIELFVDDLLLGGEQCTIAALTQQSSGWYRLNFYFRPELASFEEGANLSLKLTRVSGTTGLMIGTGGTHQSLLEMRTFRADPLRGTVYLGPDGMVAAASDPTPPQTETGIGPSGSTILGGVQALFLILGLGPVRRRRGRPAGLLLVLLLSSMAGCIGDPAEAPTAEVEDAPKSTVQHRVLDRADARTDEGTLGGLVIDEHQIPIPDASVSIMDTSIFAKTNRSGRFYIGNLSAGDYVLRVGHPSVAWIDETVHVEAGKTVELTVVLVRPASQSAAQVPHNHGDWPPEGKRPLWDAPGFAPSMGITEDVDQTDWTCADSLGVLFTRCEARVPIDYSKPVPPGSTRIEMRLDWTPAAKGGTLMGLRVETPLNQEADQDFLPRKAYEPFNVVFFPTEADPGHQRFTNWQVWVWVQTSKSYLTPAGPPFTGGGAISFASTVFRGVFALEPGHQDWWGNATRLEIFSESRRSGSPLPANVPEWTGIAWSSPKLIPQGTAELRGTFSWTNTRDVTTPAHTAWRLAFKAADSPKAAPTWRQVDGTATNNRIDFVIKVQAEWADQYYQKQSYWLFAPDDGAATITEDPNSGVPLSVNTQIVTAWYLTLSAYKDPNYVLQ